jgi:hypothetical protein
MGATTLSETSSAIRRIEAFAVCLVYSLGLGLSASAQDVQRAMNPKEIALHQLIKPRHDAYAAVGVIRNSATAQEAAPAWKTTKEIVLHHFPSAPHGAYPSSGVIRDLEGNLYGTTNGSYSDIGGGGTHDAGVVFKIDRSGHETVLYSFTGGADGSAPNGLIRDSGGNLYGTTNGGGASGAGVVFEEAERSAESLTSFDSGVRSPQKPVPRCCALRRHRPRSFHSCSTDQISSACVLLLSFSPSAASTLAWISVRRENVRSLSGR